LEEQEKKKDAKVDPNAPPKILTKEDKKELQGVFVINAEKAEFRQVTTGITGTTDIEVLDGLKDGDKIVTGSYRVLRTLKNHAKVKVDNKAPKKEDEKS